MKMLPLWFLWLFLGVPLSARQAVSITPLGHKWTASGSFLACFEIKNTSSEVFGFSGYSDDSPIYACELLKFHRWHPERAGWCGAVDHPGWQDGGNRRSFRLGRSVQIDGPRPP